MTCPRCGNEWNVSKSPCSQCGLLVRLSGRVGSAAPTSTPRQKDVILLDGMPPGDKSRRLVTDPLKQAGQRTRVSHSPSPSLPVSPLRRRRRPIDDIHPLMSGMLIHNGRYRLYGVQGRQEWSSGAYEMMWLGQDLQQSGIRVMIGELVIPDRASIMMQAYRENATRAFTPIGRNPHVPTLWDTFSDQGRNCFVFELIEGESLLARMHRTGEPLPEHEVIECCLQMTEVLELLTQQSPPLLHGQIRPEHIVEQPGSHYVLTNFSIVLAAGAADLVTGTHPSRLSPYTAPEFTQGVIDIRADLYALVATVYHLVTGNVPTSVNSQIPLAHQIGPNVSAQLNAILMKGLHPNAGQRYQRPEELRQALLALRSSRERNLSAQDRPLMDAAGGVTSSVSDKRTLTAKDIPNQERRTLLLPPEKLPPVRAGNDWQQATVWLVSIAVCLIIIVVLGRGFFS